MVDRRGSVDTRSLTVTAYDVRRRGASLCPRFDPRIKKFVGDTQRSTARSESANVVLGLRDRSGIGEISLSFIEDTRRHSITAFSQRSGFDTSVAKLPQSPQRPSTTASLGLSLEELTTELRAHRFQRHCQKGQPFVQSNERRQLLAVPDANARPSTRLEQRLPNDRRPVDRQPDCRRRNSSSHQRDETRIQCRRR